MTNTSALNDPNATAAEIEAGLDGTVVTQERTATGFSAINDPNATAEQLHAGLVGATMNAEISAQLDAVVSGVRVAAEQVERAARERVAADRAHALFRESAAYEAEYHARADDARARIAENRSLSPKGKAEAVAQVDAALAAELEKLDAVRERELSGFAERFAPSSWREAPAGVVAEAQLRVMRFQAETPRAFLQDALELLARASDASVKFEDQFAANSLLRLAVLPLLERVASGDQQEFKPFVSTAYTLAEGVKAHLDSVSGARLYRAARAELNGYRSDFKSTRALVKQNHGRFDRSVAALASPRLYPQAA